jgi:MFS family permease
MSSPLRLLLGARGLRDFGDGFVAVLLPVYLTALGFSPLEVGALAGTALFGSALLTLAVGFLGVRYDHRLLLISSAGLMAATGVALSIVDSYALLLVVAFIGSVNPSGGSASSFVPVEHAVLTRETADFERTKAFARFRALAYHGARLVARAGGVVADGCADAFLLCDGGGDCGSAHGR